MGGLRETKSIIKTKGQEISWTIIQKQCKQYIHKGTKCSDMVGADLFVPGLTGTM